MPQYLFRNTAKLSFYLNSTILFVLQIKPLINCSWLSIYSNVQRIYYNFSIFLCTKLVKTAAARNIATRLLVVGTLLEPRWWSLWGFLNWLILEVNNNSSSSSSSSNSYCCVMEHRICCHQLFSTYCHHFPVFVLILKLNCLEGPIASIYSSLFMIAWL